MSIRSEYENDSNLDRPMLATTLIIRNKKIKLFNNLTTKFVSSCPFCSVYKSVLNRMADLVQQPSKILRNLLDSEKTTVSVDR